MKASGIFLFILCAVFSAISQEREEFSFTDGFGSIKLDSSTLSQNSYYRNQGWSYLKDSVIIINSEGLAFEKAISHDSLLSIFQHKKVALFVDIEFVGKQRKLNEEVIEGLFLGEVKSSFKKKMVPESLKVLVIFSSKYMKRVKFLLNQNPGLEELYVRCHGKKDGYLRRIKKLKNLKSLTVKGFFPGLPSAIAELDSLHTLHIQSSLFMYVDPSYSNLSSLKDAEFRLKSKNLTEDLTSLSKMGGIQSLNISLREVPRDTAFLRPVFIPFGPEMSQLETLNIWIYGQCRPNVYSLIFPDDFSRIPNLKTLTIKTRIGDINSLNNILGNPSLKKLTLSGFYRNNECNTLEVSEIRKVIQLKRPDIELFIHE